MHARLCIFLLLILVLAGNGYGQAVRPTGTIKGQVLDAETKAPLIGATVLLTPAERGTSTDADGVFSFPAVPVGTYTLRFSYIGYQPLAKTDIVVRSERITFVEAELQAGVLETDAVVVTAGYFADADDQPVSVTGFSYEEIRRAPGAGGDVSRILGGLPSIARLDDMRNSLVVRGGSPIENSFYVDGIEIPNINHFPSQGSSGGAIGLLNVDFINDLDFYAGGFSAVYGDRLSSVMDVRFREGNRDAYDVQLDFNFAGIGFGAEGPVGSNGSLLVSARRSYLDFLIDTFFEDEAGAALPSYSDYQAKLVLDLSPTHRLTTLGIVGVDRSTIKADDAVEQDENFFGDWKNTAGTVGVNWRYLWGTRGFSTTALSHSFIRYSLDTFATRTGDQVLDNRSLEQAVRLRNVNHVRLSTAHRFAFGVEVALLATSYDTHYAASTDPLGHPTPALSVDDALLAAQVGGFGSYTWHPTSRLTLVPGIRLDHATYGGHTNVSPRFSASYQLTSRTALNAAAGVYHQNLPLVLLAQHEANKDLKAPVAYHVIVGVQHLVTDNTRLTVEVYHKEYDHFPLDPTQPSLFIIDQLVYEGPSFQSHEQLVDVGRANTRGVEMTLQKKLARKLYGMASGSVFRSQYRDYEGVWRRRVSDNQVVATIEGGYKFNHKHEFSARWTYAGGIPYTPFDVAASEALGQGVFDADRVNSERLPAYHSLNLRYDRRFHFSHSSLVTYLSVWNAYNRRNVAAYDWNEVDNVPRYVEQWGLLPVFGVEFEF